jgi:group I intron endonuclease
MVLTLQVSLIGGCKMFVYLIKCLANGKSYVGITTRSIETRWAEHLTKTKRISALKRAIKKYGADNFSITLLNTAKTEEQLKQLEIKYIQERKTHTTQGGYNMTWGGDGVIGYTFTEEAKARTKAGVIRSLQNSEVLAQHVATLRKHRPSSKDTSGIMKLHWADPSWKKKQSEAIKVGLNRPEVKAALTAAQDRLRNDSEYQTRRVKIMQNSEKVKEHMEKLNSDPSNHWSNKEGADKVRAKIKARVTSPEARKAASEKSKSRWGDSQTRQAITSSIKKAKNTPEAKRVASEKTKALWRDPIWRENVMKGRTKSTAPTKVSLPSHNET